MINLLKILLIFVLFFPLTIETLAQDMGTIEGTVKTNDGKPIPGATVIIKNTIKKLATDFDGKFTSDKFYPGKYTVFAFKYGYKTFMKGDVKVEAGLKTALTITLEGDPINQGCGIINGRIVDENNKPVAEAKIILAESFVPKSDDIVIIEDFILKGAKIEVSSDRDGNFIIKNVPPGKFTAFAMKDGYTSFMYFSIYVETEKTKNIDITLHEEKYSTIIGTVKSADGEAIPAANIVLAGTRLGAASDGSGHFLIREVPLGKYEVNVNMYGFKPYRQSVTIGNYEKIKLSIVIEPDISFKLQKKSELQAFEDRLEELRQTYFLAESDADQKKIKEQIRQVLKTIFDFKEKEYAEEIESNKKNIEALERLQQYRAENKADIIERRLKELLTVY